MLRGITARLLLAGLIFVFSLSSVRGQDTVLNFHYAASFDSIHSAIMNQNRLFQVFVPPQYKPGSADKYDVIYVLDGGNWNTGLLTRTQHFIEDNEQMPPVIVVSVMGIDRNVELTPTHLPLWQAPTGGADKFLGYIKNELIPYVNKNFPSNGNNTIYGHSLGGMFVVYAMLKEPETFKTYIAVDPSIWWDNGLVARMAAEKLPSLAGKDISLYVSGRQGPEFHDMRVDTMETVLKQSAPASLNWKVVAYPGESHSSVRYKTMYDGLKFTYAGFSKKIGFMPVYGTIRKDRPYIVTYFDDTSRTHYTVDGSVPTKTSPAVTRLVPLTGPAELTYKLFCNRSSYDQSFKGKFVEGPSPAPVSKPASAQPGGFQYAYYEAGPFSWPDLKKAKPVKTGLTSALFDTTLSKKTNYVLVVDGLLEIKEEGYYSFFIRGEIGSRISVGDQTLIELNQTNKEDGSYLVYLTKGFFKVHIENRDRKNQFGLLLYYMTPTSTLVADAIPIPVEAQFHTMKKKSS